MIPIKTERGIATVPEVIKIQNPEIQHSELELQKIRAFCDKLEKDRDELREADAANKLLNRAILFLQENEHFEDIAKKFYSNTK